MAAYKFWKIEAIKGFSSNYMTMNEIYFCSTVNGDIGVDEIPKTGVIATSKNSYIPSVSPTHAIDGNLDTYYGSAEIANGQTAWIQFEFPAPVEIKKFIVDSTQYENRRLFHFIIHASNDGEKYYRVLVAQKDFYKKINNRWIAHIPLNRSISGKLTSEDGVVPGLETLCFLWNEPYSLITKTTPDENGDYRIYVVDDLEYMIVHRGANGLRPQIDGPIRPKEE